MKMLTKPLVALLLIGILTACGGGSDDPTPTPDLSSQITPTPGGIVIPTGERPDGNFSGLTQRLLFDGCRVVMPIEWTSFGDRTGVTPSGANFTINGGSIASDLSWERAVQLVAQQATRRGPGTIIRGDDWVYAELSDNRGFTYRVRFGDRFCDVAVQGTVAPPQTERATWPAIIGSVEPQPAES
jgi:hypothetical protein